jgi:hypothetical protein
MLWYELVSGSGAWACMDMAFMREFLMPYGTLTPLAAPAPNPAFRPAVTAFVAEFTEGLIC